MKQNKDFSKAFAEFLESRAYNQAENYLFFIMQSAFAAGWQAAGGTLPKTMRSDNQPPFP